MSLTENEILLKIKEIFPDHQWISCVIIYDENNIVFEVQSPILKYIIKRMYDDDEIKILEKLKNYKFIPKIKHIFTHKYKTFREITEYYVVMNKIDGELLRNIFPKLSIDDITLVYKNILIAFNKLHDIGISHGDAHDLNILVDKNMDIYVIDFEQSYDNRKHNNKKIDIRTIYYYFFINVYKHRLSYDNYNLIIKNDKLFNIEQYISIMENYPYYGKQHI